MERYEGTNFAISQKLQGLCITKVKKPQFEKENFKPGVQPMEFISMDLTGEIQPPLSKGNRYALTAVCMLTQVTHFAFQLRTKQQTKLLSCPDLIFDYDGNAIVVDKIVFKIG